MRASVIGALVVLVGLAAPHAASASAAPSASWSGPVGLARASGEDTPQLNTVVCPSASACVALDDVNQVVTFDPSSPGTPTPVTLDMSVDFPRPCDDGGCPGVLACPSTVQCTLVDRAGGEVTFDPTNPGNPQRVLIDEGHRLAAVACPATGQCTAVDDTGREVTFNPTSPGAPEVVAIASGDELLAVACPSADQCTVAEVGGSALTFNPGSPTTVEVDASADASNILACPTKHECTSATIDAESTFDPTIPGSGSQATIENTAGPIIDGLDCPSAHQCTAVDNNGGELTFDPTNPSGPSNSGLHSGWLGSVACTSTTQCTAVGTGGAEVTFDPTSVGSPTPSTVDENRALAAVACPGTTQCTAVDDSGSEVTFNPVSPGTPAAATIDSCGTGFSSTCHWFSSLACPSGSRCFAPVLEGAGTTFDPGNPAGAQATNIADATAISCPNSTQCTSVGDGTEQTFNPANPGSPAQVPIDSSSFTAVACPTTSQCTAADVNGAEVTFNPGSPGGANKPVALDGGHNVTAIACPSISQCTAVDDDGNEVTFDPGLPNAFFSRSIDAGVRLNAVACPSTTGCLAVDVLGRVLVGDPATPAAWTTEPLAGANLLDGIACPSKTECLAIDQVGNAFTAAVTLPPGPPVPSPPVAHATDVHRLQRAVSVNLRCVGSTGSECEVTLRLSHKQHGKTKMLGTVTVWLANGSSNNVTLRLGASGRKLLRHDHELKALLTITQGNTTIGQSRLTFIEHQH
jgi:hypothetical protein